MDPSSKPSRALGAILGGLVVGAFCFLHILKVEHPYDEIETLFRGTVAGREVHAISHRPPNQGPLTTLTCKRANTLTPPLPTGISRQYSPAPSVCSAADVVAQGPEGEIACCTV